nr:reverse transcriptase domain-containing protein [Tanacetum cinerariifolium]
MNPTPKGRIRRSSKQKVENSNFEENPLPPVPMAENQTMAQLLQAPTDGYEDAIVIPEIAANNFKLKHGLINLVQNKQFFEHKKEDPHAHLRYFNKITSMMRGKAVVAKVSSNSSTSAVSADVAELKDMVRALLLDKKNQYSAQTSSPTPASIKAVEPNCVIYGGNHAYQNCPATSRDVYQDNIQAQLNRPQVNQPLAYQALAYQAPVSQTQSVSQNDFERYIKAYDAVLRNIQNHGQSTQNQCQGIQNQLQTVQNQLANLTDMMAKFMSANTASSSGSGTLLGMDECLALANLSASINLMPLSMWEGLSLPELTLTCMTLELADRSTSRALIDVHKGELTLRIGHEAITYNLDQTSRYSANYDQMTANKIDVTDEACEEYSQEVLGFSDVTASGSPTPSDDPIVSTTSPMLTLFGDSDFLLFEEADAFLGLEDDPDLPELDPSYYDPEGDILSLEAILNSDPSPPLPIHKQYVPSFKKELKACEAKMIKSSIDEPPEVELKDLPPHLEYAFLEGDNKLRVIIAKALTDEEKSALIKVLKSHKRAITWKLSDIQGINPEFCTHKILMEEDYKPAVQNQR